MKKCSRFFRQGLALAVCLLCLLLFAVRAHADQAKRTVRIGYIDYSGFITAEEDGTYTGYGVEYLNKIAKFTGWQYTYVYDTWDNQLKSLAAGKIDFICHAQRTPEREKTYLFSKLSTGSESSILYVRQDDDRYYYNDYENFNGMTIAFLENSFQNDEFANYAKTNGFSYTAAYYPTSDDAFAALAAGQADAVAMGSLTGREGYKIAARFGSDPFYFITGKQNAALMDELDSALNEISAEQPYYQAELYNKYYSGKNSTSTPLTREEANYLAGVGTVTVGLMPGREPLSYLDENGDPAGIIVDLMQSISQKSGLQFTYNFLGLGQTGMSYLSAGNGQLVAGVASSAFSTINPALLQSAPLLEDTVVFVGKSGMSFDPHAKLTVALPAGFIGGDVIIKNVYPTFSTFAAGTNTDCLQAIRDGRADVMLQNIYIMRQALQSPKFEGLQIFPAYSFAEELEVVALPQDSMLVSILDKTIEQFTDNEVNNIVIKHTIGKTYTMTVSDILYKYRAPLVGLAVLFAAVVVLGCALIMIRQRSLRRAEAANAKLETANGQLAVAVDSANRANRAKSQFLSRMSHEIRTPMNAIVGITEIARAHVEEPEKVTEYLGKIDISSKVLLNIINDVLDMSAIESDKLKIARAEFSMADVLTGISTLYYAQCRQKGLDFIMAADLPGETYMGDALRVNQILLNLVSNAFKFTEHGSIKVLVSEQERRDNISYLRFEVTDTGAGMTEEMQQRLFKPFEQESAVTAQKHGGSGLGMSIAKNLVDMMHGAITVKSKKGEGTTFVVNIPFEVASTAGALQAPAAKDLYALLVDSDAHSLEVTAALFARIGVKYSTAGSATEALPALRDAAAQGTPFDLCYLDLQSSKDKLLEGIRQLRAADTTGGLQLVVSAYDIAEIEEPARAAGADLFIAKPVFQSSVFNLLMQLSGGRYTRETARPDTYDFSGKRVLLAEDNELNREIACELLGMVHMEVECAVDGRDAVEKFSAAAPGYYGAILMDVQMPILDGHGATRAIRALPRPDARTIPILAMTANAFEEDISAALAAGMNGHIAKPIDTAVLYKTLQKWCQ